LRIGGRWSARIERYLPEVSTEGMGGSGSTRSVALARGRPFRRRSGSSQATDRSGQMSSRFCRVLDVLTQCLLGGQHFPCRQPTSKPLRLPEPHLMPNLSTDQLTVTPSTSAAYGTSRRTRTVLSSCSAWWQRSLATMWRAFRLDFQIARPRGRLGGENGRGYASSSSLRVDHSATTVIRHRDAI